MHLVIFKSEARPQKCLVFFITFMMGLLLPLIAMAEEKTNLDWPNLAAYAKANAQAKSQAPGIVKVVFIGDSITEFWTPAFWNSGRVNRGISGQTTPQMLLRFRADVLELNPNLVVILAGTNDVAENTGPASIEMIVGNIVSMVELAKANGLKVILGSVLPASEFPWNTALKPAYKIVTINRHLRIYAAQHGLTYVDYFSNMVDENNGIRRVYSEDGVHPNKAGYDLMERLVTQAINDNLKPSK